MEKGPWSWLMSPHKKGEVAEAKKYTGTTSNVLRGEQHGPFAHGDMGAVAQEKITVLHRGKERDVDVVTKYFLQPEGSDSLNACVATFKLLKEAGLKHIPTTYRQVGENEVLMTDYNRDGKVAVGGNENEKAIDLRIHSVTNFPGLLRSIAEDLERALKARITIGADCYFFIVPTPGGDADVDFVIGDLGGIWKYEESEKNIWQDRTIKKARAALRQFVYSHVDAENQERYDSQIAEWVNALNERMSSADALGSGATNR